MSLTRFQLAVGLMDRVPLEIHLTHQLTWNLSFLRVSGSVCFIGCRLLSKITLLSRHPRNTLRTDPRKLCDEGADTLAPPEHHFPFPD